LTPLGTSSVAFWQSAPVNAGNAMAKAQIIRK